MTNPAAQTTLLSGNLLDAFIDRAEALLVTEGGEELPVASRRDQLLPLLIGHDLQPSSVDALRRLNKLWLAANEPQRALDMLEAQGCHVLSKLPADEQREAEIMLATWKLDATASAGDATALSAQLERTVSLLQSSGDFSNADDVWGYVSRVAQHAGSHECVRLIAKERQGLVSGDPERQRYRTWDETVMLLRIAQSFVSEKRDAEAKQTAQAALKGLQHRGFDQDIDIDDWVSFGTTIATVDPWSLAHVLNSARVSLPASATSAERRGLEVRLARIESKVLYREAKLAAAIAKSLEGRYDLTSDDDDSYSALVLDWCLEANDDAAAAALAFECLHYSRPYSGGYAISVVERKFSEETPVHAFWPLARAAAAMEYDYSEHLGNENEASFIERHIRLAESISPGLPEIAALRGLHLSAHQDDLSAALPYLEVAACHVAMRSPDVIQQLWLARTNRFGLEATIRSEPPLCASAGWNYALGVWLTGDFDEALPEGISISGELGYTLATRYYEAALSQFETFFEGSQGHFKDADNHTYSMLCNNLAIAYRHYQNKSDAALELHRKGIAVSPFAEHYQGVLDCIEEQRGDHAGYVAAAEDLWNYANENGYSRHSPMNYFHGVAWRLHELNRDREIAIWLQRAHEWWQSLDSDDQADGRRNYLCAQADTLRQLAYSQPHDALTRMDSILEDVRALRMPGYLRVAGLTYQNAGMPDRAILLLQEGLALLKVTPKGANDRSDERELLEQAIRDCKRNADGSSGKPWWKIW
jgi:cellulose synthase operon protein C